eukprot:161366-Pleurochrysis_carterae.AAC.2
MLHNIGRRSAPWWRGVGCWTMCCNWCSCWWRHGNVNGWTGMRLARGSRERRVPQRSEDAGDEKVKVWWIRRVRFRVPPYIGLGSARYVRVTRMLTTQCALRKGNESSIGVSLQGDNTWHQPQRCMSTVKGCGSADDFVGFG